jgi:predicted aspartyl protease
MMYKLLFLVSTALASGFAAAQTPVTGSLVATRPTDAETLSYAPDEGHRMTVAVNVDGRGPFRFVVDTGAERTAISNELAATLGLASGGDVTLATVTDIARVPSVIIPELEIGRRTVPAIRAPALAERHLGAQGMLGVDSLRLQRVVFDFTNQELTLSASHIEDDRREEGEIVVRGVTRLGRLILTDALMDGQRIRVIVDTGSQVTVGNSALRQRLQRSGRLGQMRPLALTGVTGELVNAEYTVARRVRVGSVHMNDLPIAFAEVQLFEHLGLGDRPAILLGMDALRLFERVSIDFANRRVRLLPPPFGAVESRTRYAATSNALRNVSP